MKNQALLLLILKNRWSCTVTELMKIAYLTDLWSSNALKKKISEFEYLRYNYGPFDKEIYTTIESLLKDWLIRIDYIENPKWEEIIKYSIWQERTRLEEIIDSTIDSWEQEFVLDMLESLEWLNASSLTKIAYSTEPMTRIKATLWGTEHFMEKVL